MNDVVLKNKAILDAVASIIKEERNLRDISVREAVAMLEQRIDGLSANDLFGSLFFREFDAACSALTTVCTDMTHRKSVHRVGTLPPIVKAALEGPRKAQR